MNHFPRFSKIYSLQESCKVILKANAFFMQDLARFLQVSSFRDYFIWAWTMQLFGADWQNRFAWITSSSQFWAQPKSAENADFDQFCVENAFGSFFDKLSIAVTEMKFIESNERPGLRETNQKIILWIISGSCPMNTIWLFFVRFVANFPNVAVLMACFE